MPLPSSHLILPRVPFQIYAADSDRYDVLKEGDGLAVYHSAEKKMKRARGEVL
jgi:hypothetical protein